VIIFLKGVDDTERPRPARVPSTVTGHGGRRDHHGRAGLRRLHAPPDDKTFARISARHERTEPERISDKDATVRYVIVSGHCRPVSGHGIGIVFRDKAGAIVGGDVDGNMAPCRPGSEAESAIAFQSFPPNADLNRTEVYPYCDPFPIGDASGLGPRAADAPWNYRWFN
jgi:hypothetical protein